MASELVCGIGVASAEQLDHGGSGNVYEHQLQNGLNLPTLSSQCRWDCNLGACHWLVVSLDGMQPTESGSQHMPQHGQPGEWSGQ